MQVMIQNLRPGMYATADHLDSYHRVTEYPITTGQGVFVNLLGAQIGPLPLDAMIDVDSPDEAAETVELDPADQLLADAVNARNDLMRGTRHNSPAWRARSEKALDAGRAYAQAAGLSLQEAADRIRVISEKSLKH
jgi:hypothetical protein